MKGGLNLYALLLNIFIVRWFDLERGKSVRVGDWVLEVESDRYNPLIGRREIVLKAGHPLKSTPSRKDLRARLAKVYGVDASRLYVRSIFTRYGSGESRVKVHIYDVAERALAFEPDYVIERNGGVEFKTE